MVNLAIISDIHSNLPALKAVLEDIEKRNIDHIICLGDLIGYYTWPIECIQLVSEICKDNCIRGNHDTTVMSKNFLKEIKWYNEGAQKTL